MESFRKLKLNNLYTDPELYKRNLQSFLTHNDTLNEAQDIDLALLANINLLDFGNIHNKNLKEQSVDGLNEPIEQKWSHIIWPKPIKACGFHPNPKDSKHNVSKSRSQNDDQKNNFERRREEKFIPVQTRSLDTTHSYGSMNQECWCYKRVKMTTFNIQNTGSYSFCVKKSINVDHVDINNDIKKIKGVSKIDKSEFYEFQNYNILFNEKEASIDNLTTLKEAFNVLRGLFKSTICLDEIQKLTDEAFLVFSLVCEKKFKIKINSSRDTTALNQLADIIKNKTVNKRPEECKKIIFSYTIKQLKHRLRDRYTELYRKNTFDEFFYMFYFDEISKKEGILIEDFYYPIASTKCKKNSAKTINQTYLNNIRKSDKFMTDIGNYITKRFASDYNKEVDSKLLDLVTRWENELTKTESLTDLKEQLQSYFKGSKSKLPWTIYEVQYAIGKVKHIVC